MVLTRDEFSIFLFHNRKLKLKLLNTEPTWSNIIDPEFWSDYHITDMVHPRRAKKKLENFFKQHQRPEFQNQEMT